MVSLDRYEELSWTDNQAEWVILQAHNWVCKLPKGIQNQIVRSLHLGPGGKVGKVSITQTIASDLSEQVLNGASPKNTPLHRALVICGSMLILNAGFLVGLVYISYLDCRGGCHQVPGAEPCVGRFAQLFFF